MGKINILFGLLCILACNVISYQAKAQEHIDKQARDLDFSSVNVFIIANIFGDVTVEGTSSSKGLLEIEEKIKADSKSELEEAKKDLDVKIEKEGDTLFVYISSPYIEYRKKHKRFGYRMDNYDVEYHFEYNFSAKIPKNVELIASTINNGDIYVSGINGKLKTNNVNGSIKLENVIGQTYAVTVNGDVDVNFSKNPDDNCKFKTINGEINVLCDKDLSADVTYKSMNGEFFTNYNITAIASETKKGKTKKGKSTFYKMGKTPQFRIGSGKIKMSFETLNGDMIVKYK